MTEVLTEQDILERREVRDRLVDRIDVLQKVKDLLTLPELDMMTTQQVADFYEVNVDTLQKCYRNNKEEIESDGAGKKSAKSMLSRLGPNFRTKKYHGYAEIQLSDDVTLRVPNAGIILFPKRAILRVGMLLRDSEVAKEVREQLLNTEGHATVEERTEDITEESGLIENLCVAFAKHDPMGMLSASQDLYNFQQRHIDELTAENVEIKETNQMLTAENMRWEDRQSVNKAVRSIAYRADKSPSIIWGILYNELRYKHHICLSNRGGSPYIQYVKEDEWPAVQQSLCAVCEEFGISPAKVFEKARMELTA